MSYFSKKTKKKKKKKKNTAWMPVAKNCQEETSVTKQATDICD
jgi:hypothetical protein